MSSRLSLPIAAGRMFQHIHWKRGTVTLLFGGVLYTTLYLLHRTYTTNLQRYRPTDGKDAQRNSVDSRKAAGSTQEAAGLNLLETNLLTGESNSRTTAEGRCGKSALLCNISLCSNLGPDGALMYIYTDILNIKARNFIRNSFASDELLHVLNMRRLFVLGMDQSLALPRELEEERKKYGDILVGNFVDSYRNLSRKGLTALRFIENHCLSARWLIKVDDDVVSDTETLLSYLRQNQSKARYSLFGAVYKNTGPVFCDHSVPKWCVDRRKYGHIKLYPPYLLGVGFAFTSDLVPRMLERADQVTVFPIDDVYVTGFLTQHIPNKTFIDLGNNAVRASSIGRTSMTVRKHLFVHCGIMSSDISDMEKRWEELKESKDRRHI